MLPKVWLSSDIRLALDYSLFVCNKASMETERQHSEKPFDTVLIPSVWSVGNEHRWVWLDTVGLWWWVACSMTRALCVCVSRLVMSDSLWPYGLEPARSLYPWIFQARILEWVAISFSRGSSWPKARTQVSHIAGKFFTVWATRDASPACASHS